METTQPNSHSVQSETFTILPQLDAEAADESLWQEDCAVPITQRERCIASGPNYPVIFWLVFLHVGALAAPFFITWQAIAITVVLYWLTGSIGVCLGYHRLLTHGDRNYLFLIGFDVAVTVSGPVLIEANWPGDLSGPHICPVPLWRDPDFVRCADSFLTPLKGQRTHFHPDIWSRNKNSRDQIS